MSSIGDTAAPGPDDVYVGARKRLDENPRYDEKGVVEVTYYDANANEGDGEWRSVEMCPNGAIELAKELRRWAGIVSDTGTARRVRRTAGKVGG